MKFVIIVIPLVGFDICSLELSMGTFSLDFYPIMVFEAFIFHCVTSREP